MRSSPKASKLIFRLFTLSFLILAFAACSRDVSGEGVGSTTLVTTQKSSHELASALDCKIDPIPAKTINRCATLRTRGGQVQSETQSVAGNQYSVWAANQTYEQLYTYNCTDKCGKTVTVVGDVSWDCVAPEEIAALGIDSPESATGVDDQDSCGGVKGDLTEAFNTFINENFNDGKSRPASMPHGVTGINYWDGDSGK